MLDQSVHELELIVVDDGSSDSTPDVVAAIQDPRLKLIRLTDNRAVHARNMALSIVRGRYIAFQNSDDLWQPGVHAPLLEAGLQRGGRTRTNTHDTLEHSNTRV